MPEYNEAMKKLMPLPARIARLPISDNGYVTPWFAGTLPDGRRELRGADYDKRELAISKRLCWVCGEVLGAHLAFVLGPMCTITRTTSEPPCHLQCAHFTTVACPFLTKPRMRRNRAGLEDLATEDAPGLTIERNPGVTAIWITRSFRRFAVAGGWLIRVGEPEQVEWWCEGRLATRAEVEESIHGGYPALQNVARAEGQAALAALDQQRSRAMSYLPAAA